MDKDVQQWFRLDGIITMVDAKHIEQHLDEEKPEGAENESVEQVAFADRIILNKTDLVPTTEAADIAEVVRRLNPDAEIIPTTHSQVKHRVPQS